VRGEEDIPPYFGIAYRREETESSNGMIEGVYLELLHTMHGELLDYLTNVTQGQAVNPNEDWPIEVNQEVLRGGEITEIALQPVEPIAGYDGSDVLTMPVEVSNKMINISSTHLQLVQSQSRGKMYLLRYHRWGGPVDAIEVRGKRSSKAITVFVYLSSSHDIDFVME
jgi:hypothetical protein